MNALSPDARTTQPEVPAASHCAYTTALDYFSESPGDYGDDLEYTIGCLADNDYDAGASRSDFDGAYLAWDVVRTSADPAFAVALGLIVARADARTDVSDAEFALSLEYDRAVERGAFTHARDAAHAALILFAR